MLKKAVIVLGVFAGALMLVLTWITARYVDKEEIMRVERERARLQVVRDSLYSVVAIKDSMQKILQKDIDLLQTQAQTLRAQVDLLEEARQRMQLSVRNIRKKEDLQARLRETFPEMAYSQWGVTEVFDDTGVGIEYLLVPLWFSETFIIDHQDALNYRRQVDKLKQLDSLNVVVDALQDSLLALEVAKSQAYKAGFDDAFAKYDTLSQRYIELLKKPPQIKFGLPQWSAVAAGAAAGVAAGILIAR